MSVNGAEPTGEVKKEIEEPILGDNGVNYDVYAEDFAPNKTSNEDTFFDSKEYAKRQKTELITNVKGADKIKREEEKREAADEKRKLKTLRKEVQQGQIAPKETQKKKKETDEKALVRRYKRAEFFKKHGKKITIAVVLVIILSATAIVTTIKISNEKEEQQTKEEIAVDLSHNVKDIDEAREHYGAESEAYYEAVQRLINEAKHNANKANLLLLRAEDLANTNTPELIKKALEDAYAAEELYPTIESAFRIEDIERKLGNEEKANEYKAIKEERVQSSGQPTGEG
ncbi:MAG: hypothetical protein MJ154_02405 [Candidatus Saccharibacteria bacterium]|nr:hypothetical protein [Candidatus Saccharibacteria bacterium]